MLVSCGQEIHISSLEVQLLGAPKGFRLQKMAKNYWEANFEMAKSMEYRFGTTGEKLGSFEAPKFLRAQILYTIGDTL